MDHDQAWERAMTNRGNRRPFDEGVLVFHPIVRDHARPRRNQARRQNDP